MYILPPICVSKTEVRIPPEFMRAMAALVQEPGWAISTYCNTANVMTTPVTAFSGKFRLLFYTDK
jgi:hypothetical protein